MEPAGEQTRGFRLSGEAAQVAANPNAAVEIALGPLQVNLIPQKPGSGLHVAGICDAQVKRFVFKKAHLSREDFRIFDANGHLVCNSHHYGKNPYASLDPLGVGHDPNRYNMIGEMESLCHVTGYQGVPSFKVRPKPVSMHGRQLALDCSGRTMFSVAKISRVSTMSIRHNLEVCAGDSSDRTYIIEADMMGRTMQIKNNNDELVAYVAKSTKALIQTAVLGSGSELQMDVAPGVDWTAIVAVLMVVQQVGKHYIKDLFENFVMDPLKDTVTDTVVQATGTQGLVDTAAHYTNSATHTAGRVNYAHSQFNHLHQNY